MHSENKSDRLAKIDDQMTFIQDSLIQQQVSSLTPNETTSELNNPETLTVQEQVQNKIEEEEQEITSNQENMINE